MSDKEILDMIEEEIEEAELYKNAGNPRMARHARYLAKKDLVRWMSGADWVIGDDIDVRRKALLARCG